MQLVRRKVPGQELRVSLRRLLLMVLAQLLAAGGLRHEQIVDRLLRPASALNVGRQPLPVDDVDLGLRAAELVLDDRLCRLRVSCEGVRCVCCGKFGRDIATDVTDLLILGTRGVIGEGVLEAAEPSFACFLRASDSNNTTYPSDAPPRVLEERPPVVEEDASEGAVGGGVPNPRIA